MSRRDSHRPSPFGSTISRRRAITTLGASAFGLAAVPGATAELSSQQTAVRRPNRLSRRRLRRRALASDAVDHLVAEVEADDWTVNAHDAIVLRTDDSSGRFHTVGIPLDRRDDQGVILWTDDGPYPVQSRRFRPIVDDRFTMRTTLMRDPPITAIGTVESFSFGFCRINWPCVLSIAGAWAGTIAACGACLIEPTRLTCLSCAGAAAGAIGTTMGCSVCR